MLLLLPLRFHCFLRAPFSTHFRFSLSTTNTDFRIPRPISNVACFPIITFDAVASRKMKTAFFTYLCLVIGLMVPRTTSAQKIELGMLAGGSYYYGDIVNYSFQPESIKPAGGVFIRYHITPSLSLRGNLMYCRIFGADSNLTYSNDTKWQKERNLAFYSDIFELSGIFEYNLIADENKGRKIRDRFIPYVFGGIGVFYFEPKAIHPITGQPIALRPLKLDGTSYSPVAYAMPLGAGIRVYVNKNWQIGLEFGMRFTTTSHLDDIDGSSKYPNPEKLASDDARIMASRNKNSLNPVTQMVPNISGKPRGKIDYITDIYFINGVTVSYRFWTFSKAIRKGRF
jgi:hypothetical protein